MILILSEISCVKKMSSSLTFCPSFDFQEIAGDIDTSSAYMLFYEREGLSHSRYLPNVSGLPQPDIKDLDDDIDSDLKKLCTIM